MRSLSIYVLMFCSYLNITSLDAPIYKWKGTKEVQNGIVYIHNPEKGIWQGKKAINFEKVLTIGIEDGDEKYILARPINVCTGKDRIIYICDHMDHCIKVYNNSGQYLKTIGQYGKGPGELIWPNSIAITSDNRIAILSQQRISYFTTQGEFIDSFNLIGESGGSAFMSLASIPNSENIFASKLLSIFVEQSNKDEYIFHKINKKGEIIKKFGEPEFMGITRQGRIFSEPNISTSKEGKLFVSFNYPYKIRIYDSNLNHQCTVSRENKIFLEFQLEIIWRHELIIPRIRMRGGPQLLPDGKFIVCVLDLGPNYMDVTPTSLLKDEESKYFHDLYDADGRFLLSFDLGNQRIAHIDDEGFAYAISGFDDTPRVTKYKIEFINK